MTNSELTQAVIEFIKNHSAKGVKADELREHFKEKDLRKLVQGALFKKAIFKRGDLYFYTGTTNVLEVNAKKAPKGNKVLEKSDRPKTPPRPAGFGLSLSLELLPDFSHIEVLPKGTATSLKLAGLNKWMLLQPADRETHEVANETALAAFGKDWTVHHYTWEEIDTFTVVSAGSEVVHRMQKGEILIVGADSRLVKQKRRQIP